MIRITVHDEWLRNTRQSYFGYSLKLQSVQKWITIYHILKVATQQW